MSFADVPIECFEVEAKLPEILWLEPSYFQLNGYKAVQAPMEEEQVERQVAISHLKREL